MWFSVLATLASLWHTNSVAAEQLPPFLTGSWGTSESLYIGAGAQGELHLEPDGIGILAGSSPEGKVSGKQSNQPARRVIMGFPVRATAEGDTLSLQPFLPSQVQPKELEGRTVRCRYEKAGPTLTCSGPDGIASDMRRRSAPLSAEIAAMIAAIRAKSALDIPADAQVKPN